MEEKNKLLTIGQFATLHGINKKTLMWYDEIGLFRPAFIHPQNGYRFYNYHQSALLETILLLRELDVSIPEIQSFIRHRSAQSLQTLLEEKIAALDLKITHLNAVRQTLCNHRQTMETLLTMDLSQINQIQKKERYLITIPTDRDISYDKQVEMITAKTHDCQLHHLHDASYGTLISVESLKRGDFDDYCGLFIEIPVPLPNAGLHVQPAGTYLQAFFQGDWENMPEKYQQLFSYAQKHHLQLYGFSYEKILNETVTDRMEDYIVQIEIAIL